MYLISILVVIVVIILMLCMGGAGSFAAFIDFPSLLLLILIVLPILAGTNMLRDFNNAFRLGMTGKKNYTSHIFEKLEIEKREQIKRAGRE